MIEWIDPELRPHSAMPNVLLTTCRVALCAWVGAAALFVVTAIREIQSPEPAVSVPAVTDTLVGIRFPAYYAFGFALVTVTLICVIGLSSNAIRQRRWILGLLTAALALMVIDYVWIYEPLLEMITPPGKARTARFEQYHNASKIINALDVGLCFIVAVLLCRPAPPRHRDN